MPNPSAYLESVSRGPRVPGGDFGEVIRGTPVYGIARRQPIGVVVSASNANGDVTIDLGGEGIPGVITGNELRVADDYAQAIREHVEREMLARSREGFLDTAYGSSLTSLASRAYNTDRLYGETDEALRERIMWQVHGREPMSIPPWACFQVKEDSKPIMRQEEPTWLSPKEGRTRYQAILEDDVFEGVVW